MKALFILLFTFLITTAFAQTPFRIIVKDQANKQPLQNVSAYLKTDKKIIAQSDKNGLATLNNLPNGSNSIIVNYIGYEIIELVVNIPDSTTQIIFLKSNQHILEDVTIVASTRNNEKIENSTTKVEVLGLEEMNEESAVKPGNVASILGDISGVQIQQSSATSGNSNIRIQGLDGKYTQMLRDGMPLFDGFSGGFGVLSIPPLDLKQLELIKGASSTLYGSGAIAGLVNFISKKPSFLPDASIVLNTTTLNETNFNGYFAQRWNKIGFTLFAGQTNQKQVDVDKDGLSDAPKLNSTLIHPVLFLYPSDKSSISLGWAGSFENRKGGDMIAVAGNATPNHSYFENNKLNRNTFTLIAENKFNNILNGTIKGTLSSFDRTINTDTYFFKGKQKNYYLEASLSALLQKHTLIGGLNILGNDFNPSPLTPIMLGQINNNTIGTFIQDSWRVLESTKIETGLRLDHTNFGNFLLPRLAVFHRLNEKWGLRMGIGTGYKSPDPLAPQVIDYNLNEIHPIDANAIAERSLGGNLEANYKYDWDEEHSVFINNAFFITKINHPYIGVEQTDGTLNFYNANNPIVTKGLDTYIQLKLHAWEIYFGYTYTNAKRKYLAQNEFVPLTPKNRAASTLVYEIEGKWRFGIEASYNGSQYRDNDSKTANYVFMAAMIERKFGSKFSLVLNGENLFDERQSNYEKIYTGSIQAPKYKPIWAPLDGRVINLALKFMPFAKN